MYLQVKRQVTVLLMFEYIRKRKGGHGVKKMLITKRMPRDSPKVKTI